MDPIGNSAQKLIHEALSQTDRRIVLAAKIDLGKHIFIALDRAIRIDINHRAIHLEQRNHLRNVGLHHQRVRLPGVSYT